jgi:hypothetical protein
VKLLETVKWEIEADAMVVWSGGSDQIWSASNKISNIKKL